MILEDGEADGFHPDPVPPPLRYDRTLRRYNLKLSNLEDFSGIKEWKSEGLLFVDEAEARVAIAPLSILTIGLHRWRSRCGQQPQS